MTDLKVDPDDRWVEVDFDTDPRTWAEQTVARRRREEGVPDDPVRAGLITDGVTRMVEILTGQDPPPFMAFLLYPQADQPIVTTVTVRAEPIDEPVTLDEITEALRLPDQMLEQPADQQLVDTRSGPATRLIQRYLAPVEPGVEQVQEALAYAWVLADGEGPLVVTVSTSFTDLVEAADWRQTVDDLARTLTITP